MLKSIALAVSLLFSTFAFAVPQTLIMKDNFGMQYTFSILGGTAPIAIQPGVYMQRVSVGFAALNAATSGVAVTLGTAIPNKAIIQQVYYNVTTTFLDNGTAGNLDTSTLSIGANTAVDLKAAIAISNGANAWDAGIGAGIPLGTAATMVKTTASRFINVTWTHGTGDSTALVAGAMDIYIQYVQGL